MASILVPEGSKSANGHQIALDAALGPSSVQPATAVLQRRVFIGPMPERVIALTESQKKRTPKLTLGSVFSLSLDAAAGDKGSNGDKSEEVSRLLKENAYRFFLQEGGNAEDWGDEEEQDVTDRLLERWKESEWGLLWSRRHHRRTNEAHNATHDQWFGNSFEIGTLMGVGIMQDEEHLNTVSVRAMKGAAMEDSMVPTTTQDTFVSAQSSFLADNTSAATMGLGAPKRTDSMEDPTPASSRTGLLPPQPSHMFEAGPSMSKAKTEVILRPALHKARSKISARTDGVAVDLKGKARVHYADDLIPSQSGEPTTPEPVPPEEVLERTQSTVDPNTSLAATIVPEPKSPTPTEFRWGDVVLRDRMLVRVDYSKSEGITQFDDAINRTTRDLQYEDWGEFLVVWRRDSVEIYEDHTTPGKDWATGHKRLSYVIPLKSSRTHISLYSFVDSSFAIVCPPTNTRLNAGNTRWIFSRAKEGSNIFVFKHKSRSRAQDWLWHLWRHTGGKIPSLIDIHNPRLSTKVTIDIPDTDDLDNAKLYQLFKRDNIIRLCTDSLRKVPTWKFLIETEIRGGRSLQLAWRLNAILDWVWLDEDVLGQSRDWAVLCGLAFKQSASRHPVLEIRVAEHFPNHVHLKSGTRLEEPHAIEGYLDRIRPNTQSRQQVYLVTHGGYLFTLNSTSSYPPTPPGLIPASGAASDPETLRNSEVRRGVNQMMAALSVMDLRTIVAIRRAFQPTPVHVHNVKVAANDHDQASMGTRADEEPVLSDDEDDEGGEAYIAKATDRPRARMRRCFELLLRTGQVVRYEAYSSKVAIEWIERLRSLVDYWRRRHRTHAKQEIELAQALRPRLTPQTRICQDEHDAPEAPADLSNHFPAVDSLYNWCVIEGCKSVVRTGRVYMRKGLRGQYKLVQLFLMAGHLVRFRIDGQAAQYPALKAKINLLDAYVFSGFLAAQMLPRGEYRPNAPPAPRRYQDGLETEDREEDLMFVIWYRPYPTMASADEDPTTTPVNSKTVPTLSTKHKMIMFKTRSAFERDAWCYVLNSEIEKIVRAQKTREMKLRETGNPVKLK